MNLLHDLIFRWSHAGAARREGNPKSQRATIQPQKFKAVKWTPSRLPLCPDAWEAGLTSEAIASRGRGPATHPPIAEPASSGGPFEEKSAPQNARFQPPDDTNGAPANANTDWW